MVKHMGHSYATVKIYGKDISCVKELSLLVDTGSTYTWLSKDFLTDLKIVPKGSRKFTTIEGKIVERPIGEAVIEYENEKATTIVVFGEKDDKQVLGVHALEGLALEVDPVTERLKKVEAVLAV